VKGGMKDTDMITFEAGGEGKIHDQFSKNKFFPPIDASNDIKEPVIKKIQQGTKNKYKFTCYRELTNSDTKKDYQFKLGEQVDLIYAESPYTSNVKEYHGPNYDQADSIILEDTGSSEDGKKVVKKVRKSKISKEERDKRVKGWLNHGIGMGVVWILLAFIMFATNRWY